MTSFPWSILKRRREELRLTQKDVARSVGVSAVMVGYWERGEHQPMGGHLLSLAKALQLRPEEIVGHKHRETALERELQLLCEAYVNSSPELQQAALRFLGADLPMLSDVQDGPHKADSTKKRL